MESKNELIEPKQSMQLTNINKDGITPVSTKKKACKHSTRSNAKGNQRNMEKAAAPHTKETHQISRDKKPIMATALIFSTNIHADLTYIGMIPMSKTRKFGIEITIEKISFLTFIKILLTSQQNQKLLIILL